MLLLYILFIFFFFNDTATTEIYTLSLHDALPISGCVDRIPEIAAGPSAWNQDPRRGRDLSCKELAAIEASGLRVVLAPRLRSEEHTSELQSHSDLVCRLLLEKKKKQASNYTSEE